MPVSSLTVSVVVPVYRVQERIEACMESLAAQTVAPTEVLLVDDQGQDDSIARACAVLTRCGLPHRVVVQERNWGLSVARNAGLAEAGCEVVWFLDGDDVAEPLFLEHLLTCLERDEADVAVCRTVRVDADGRELGHEEGPYPVHRCSGEELARLMLLGEVRGYAWNRVCRRSALRPGLFPPGLRYEDFPAMLDVALRARSVSLTDAVLYRYTRVPGSLSERFGPASFDLLRSADLVADRVQEHQAQLPARAASTRRWQRALLVHRYRDGVIPLANLALRALQEPGASTATRALVDRAVRTARSEVSMVGVAALLAAGRPRLAAAGFVLRISPRAYHSALQRAWDRQAVASGGAHARHPSRGPGWWPMRRHVTAPARRAADHGPHQAA